MGAALVPTIFKPEKNLVVVFLRIKLLLSEMATLVSLSDYLRITFSFFVGYFDWVNDGDSFLVISTG